jgi:hypothetical protein
MSRAYQPFDPYEFLRQNRAGLPAKPANPANIVSVRSQALADLAGLAGADRTPPEWRDALDRIDAGRRPESIPAERWAQAVADARYLVREWSVALSRCGWTLTDIFSAHREQPLARFDAMGVCLLLQGRKVGPIDQNRIAIRRPGGAVLHFRRPRVSVAETVMLWDLRD